LASIRALIQITTATVKASPPAQASSPATTSNVKTTQVSGPAATSSAKTNQPSNTSVLVNTPIIAPLITIGSSTYTPNPLSTYTISSSSLILNVPAITVSGTVYSLSPGATKFVVSPASRNAASSIQARSTTLQPTPATVTPKQSSSSTNLVSSSAVVIGEPPRVRPPQSTERLSLASGSFFMVIGGTTATLTATVSGGLGPVICSGLGGCESWTATRQQLLQEMPLFGRKKVSSRQIMCAIGGTVLGIALF
jgi:hypothetical protein